MKKAKGPDQIERDHWQCSSVIELKRAHDRFLMRYMEALKEHEANCTKGRPTHATKKQR